MLIELLDQLARLLWPNVSYLAGEVMTIYITLTL